METITFTIDARRGSIRADRPLYLAAAYNVLFAGDYAGGTPQLILSNHKGDPVAETRTEDDATTLELDTAELAKEFKDAGIVACPGSVTLHLWAFDSSNNTIAQSDIPVFYSPYYTAPTGTLTKIDTQGPPGSRGLRGLNGAGMPTFHIDEEGHLIATSPDPNIIYASGEDGQPDPSKPRWILGNGEDGMTAGHLYYIVYDEQGDVQARHDLGLVKGAKGDKGDTPEMPGIDPQPTPGSTNLVTSGGVAAAIEGVANDAANLFVAKSKIPQALAGVGDPAKLATIGQVKDFLSAMKNAISYLATAIAAALFIAQPAHGTTLENLDLTNEVYTATETAALVAAATNSINAATVPLSDADAARGVTFDDPDGGIDQNVAMRIGLGAKAGLPDDAASAAADNTVLRSAGVAIGPNANATATNADGTKNQGVAVGWNSKAGYNAVAIGGGAQHGGETDMTGNSTYAPGETAVAIGYSAKATNLAGVAIGRGAVSLAEGAAQIGAGTNSTANTLKFQDTWIVKDGKIAGETDTNEVARMIQAESAKGIMYGSTHKTNVVDEATGATNTWSYIKLEGVNDAQNTDPMFIMAVNEDTNGPYAASFPLYPGSPNRRDIYSAQTVDRIVAGLSPTGHVHDAADIATGVLAADRIPPLDASKITSGTFAASRIPAATASVAGAVRPDGTTLSVANGVMSARLAIEAAANYTDAALTPVDVTSTNVARYASGALSLTIQPGATLTADLAGWHDGAATFARITPGGAYSVASSLVLVGYGYWPTNTADAVFVRSGSVVLCNVIREE